MRKEIENWWKQSQADLKSAKNCMSSGDYYFSVFASQQAVEKALKALFLQEKKGLLPQSHSLIHLARESGVVPDKFSSFLRELTPKFIDTRYPDAAVDLPSRIYDAQNTEKFITGAREVLGWVKTKLK